MLDLSQHADPSTPRGNGAAGGGGADDGAPPDEGVTVPPNDADGDRVELPPLAAIGPAAQRRRPPLRKLRAALVLLGLALLAFVSWIFGIMMAVTQDLPALENRAQYARAQNSVVYDSQGKLVATLTNNEGRILLSSDQIASTMKEAVVAIEDARFYDHRGVDYRGIARAVYQDLIARSAEQGASTITQQFVKNALDAQGSRTIFQKLREAALAYHLERRWPKDKILTEYLNSAYFGEGGYGIEAAAQTYFGSQPGHEGCGAGEGTPTCASQLDPGEAALLAGIIASPSAYSPRANPEVARERRDLVLVRMAELGYITSEELERYSSEPVPAPAEIAPPSESSEAPYFTSWLRQQLVDLYGAGQAFGGGLAVHSTLDLDLQRQVETVVSNRIGGIEPTAAVVVLDNETSGVLAMVGGSDYEESPFNLATQGARQPGSAFKPFTLVTALEEGHSSSEVFASAEQEIPFKSKIPRKNGNGTRVINEIFPVTNYEDQYLGSASIATATTYSDNAVYTQLGMQVGPADVAQTANELGIQTDLSTQTRYAVNDGKFEPYNPALILGGLETGVTPLEMAHAYGTIAADGRRVTGTMAAVDDGVVAINKVTKKDGDEPNSGGKPVATGDGESGENEVEAEQVIDPSVAEEARSILSTVVSSGTGAAATTGVPTWGKTGTTDDNGDAWFCGATEAITACVWVGHPERRLPMRTEFGGSPVDGGTYPALIFADIINAWKGLAEARGEYEEEEEYEDDAELEAPVPTEPAPAPEPAPPPPAPAPEIASGGGTEETAPVPQGEANVEGGGAGGGDGGGGAGSGGGADGGAQAAP